MACQSSGHPIPARLSSHCISSSKLVLFSLVKIATFAIQQPCSLARRALTSSSSSNLNTQPKSKLRKTPCWPNQHALKTQMAWRTDSLLPTTCQRTSSYRMGICRLSQTHAKRTEAGLSESGPFLPCQLVCPKPPLELGCHALSPPFPSGNVWSYHCRINACWLHSAGRQKGRIPGTAPTMA